MYENPLTSKVDIQKIEVVVVARDLARLTSQYCNKEYVSWRWVIVGIMRCVFPYKVSPSNKQIFTNKWIYIGPLQYIVSTPRHDPQKTHTPTQMHIARTHSHICAYVVIKTGWTGWWVLERCTHQNRVTDDCTIHKRDQIWRCKFLNKIFVKWQRVQWKKHFHEDYCRFQNPNY